MAISNTIRFNPGSILCTPGAMEALTRNGKTPLQCLSRHLSGDWGCMPEADKKLNDLAVEEGERLMSAYALPDGEIVWVITEAENNGMREATTLLLPEEY